MNRNIRSCFAMVIWIECLCKVLCLELVWCSLNIATFCSFKSWNWDIGVICLAKFLIFTGEWWSWKWFYKTKRDAFDYLRLSCGVRLEKGVQSISRGSKLEINGLFFVSFFFFYTWVYFNDGIVRLVELLEKLRFE